MKLTLHDIEIVLQHPDMLEACLHRIRNFYDAAALEQHQYREAQIIPQATDRDGLIEWHMILPYGEPSVQRSGTMMIGVIKRPGHETVEFHS